MVKEKKLTPAQQAKEELRRRKEEELIDLALEKKHQMKKQQAVRLVILRESQKIIDGIYKEIAKKLAQMERQMNWERYVACENKPYGFRPEQLRQYLAQWELQIIDEQRRYHDWMLQVDERSLLDQSPFRIDVSGCYLRSVQPDFCQPFYQRIEHAISVHDEVENVLANVVNFRLRPKIAEDIETVRDELQQFLWRYLDYMSFIVTGNIDREMRLLSPTDAQFEFQSSLLCISMFTHRDVPLPTPNDEEESKLLVNFESMKLSLLCPRHMSLNGSTVRACWFNFNHYSGHAASQAIRFEDAEYIKRTLLESCRQEFEEIESLEQNVLTRMRLARQEYEAKLAADLENPPMIKKNEKVKKTAAPPQVTDRTVVNMMAEFLSIENDEHVSRMLKLQPQHGLRLAPNELNLRLYRIMGGTFAIHYLQRPAQSKKFYHHLFQNTYQLPNVLKYNYYSTQYTRAHFASDESIDIAQRESILQNEAKQFDELLQVSLQLPANVCWWEAPTIVRWQPWEDSHEFRQLRQELQYYNLHYDEIERAKEAKLFNRRRNATAPTQSSELEDFDLVHRTSDIRLFYAMTKYIIPKLSLTYRFECELKAEQEQVAAELKRREHIKREQEEDRRLWLEAQAQAKEDKIKRRLAREERRIEREQRQAEEAILAAAAAKAAEAAAAYAAAMAGDEEAGGAEGDAAAGDAEATAADVEEVVEEPPESESSSEEEGEDGETAIPYDQEEVQFKTIELGSAAHAIYPEHKDIGVVEILENSAYRLGLRQTSLTSFMLSHLMNEIDIYNSKELPYFKVKEVKEVRSKKRHTASSIATRASEFQSMIIPEDQLQLQKAQQLQQEKKPAKGKGKGVGKKADKSMSQVAGQKTSKDKGGKPPTDIIIQTQEDAPPKAARSMGSELTRKSKRKTKSSRIKSSPSMLAAADNSKLRLIPHPKGKWTTEGIYRQSYDNETQRIVFKTTQIGIFGFAQNQYYHFPLQRWELKPNYDELAMSAKYILIGVEISLTIVISPDGYQLTIDRPRPKVCPVQAPEGFVTLKELKKFLVDANMNIFPDIDTVAYVPDEKRPDETLINYKHEPTANHVYGAMGFFCQTHHFQHSKWNRLAERRQIVLNSRQVVENRAPEPFAEIKVTPNDAAFVRAEELCTQLTQFVLDFKLEPEEQEFCCDIFELLVGQSIDKSKKKQANTNVDLRWNIIEFLRAAQPFSYS